MEMLDRFLEEVKTLPRMFYNTVENFGERPALKFKEDGAFRVQSYSEFAETVEKLGSGLLELGLEKGDRVCLMAYTSAQWAWADFSIQTAGGVTVTIYPTLSPDEIAFIVNHSEAKYLYVNDKEILSKVKKAWDKMPTLKYIIVLDKSFEDTEDKVLSIKDLIEKGTSRLKTTRYDQWKNLLGEDSSSIIYTSGTTGNLKGILLTHENMIGALTRSLKHLVIGGYRANYNDVAFSLLPLAHIWERNNSYLAMISLGACIGFAEKPVTLLQDIQEIKPTWVLLVPRLWDRIFTSLKGGFTATEEGKKLFEWAMQVGNEVLEHRIGPNGAIDLTKDPTEGINNELKEKFNKANELFFKPLYNLLGGRLKIAYSGGAFLAPDLHRNYLAMGFPLLNGWGLTETAAGISHGYPNATKIGWLSKMVPGVEAKLDEDGEILVKGIGVITQYYKNPEETALAFTEDGWFKTGDIGEFDEEGFLRIVDRKKYIIVLDTGKNVAPAKIESKFTNSPIIEQVLIIGNDRKYISALVVPAFDYVLYLMKEKGIEIDDASLEYANINGITQCVKVPDYLIENPYLIELVDAEIKRINKELDEYETIKRFSILPRKFTEATGELTPTLKIKNNIVIKNFADKIEQMYT